VCEKFIKNYQSFGKNCLKTAGGGGLTYTVVANSLAAAAAGDMDDVIEQLLAVVDEQREEIEHLQNMLDDLTARQHEDHTYGSFLSVFLPHALL